MDTTFITIHDLSDEARILYSSDSIVDILGHTPDEVVNRSVWEWFHPQEVPLAKAKHRRGVKLDKAAVLAYAHIKNRQGVYVCCECCFSVVYDVLVCCTSVYQHGDPNASKRALDAPLVRRIFSSSPKDPRYHMLSHLSTKFSLGEDEQTHEPRAALFLNRFTRSLTIMYATSGIEEIIGISSENMKGRSFYYCIQENCLDDAVRVLESAKGNDSIAYLRFRFRDPRRDDLSDAPSESEDGDDDEMTDVTSDDDESEDSYGRRSSANGSTSTDSMSRESSSSFAVDSPHSGFREDDIELEAVVSCTSDGLVVCLRRARPMVPAALLQFTEPTHHGGIFAAPWAQDPIFRPAPPQLPPFPLGAQHPAMQHHAPPSFMDAIRDVAVFAWALTGINGCLAEFARGNPAGESQPAEGFPVWDPPAHLEPKHSSSGSSGYGSGHSSASNFDPFNDPY